MNKNYQELFKRYKKLEDNYFIGKLANKDKMKIVNEENQRLTKTYEVLNERISAALLTYEKKNKAKQDKILREQQDFEEDCKAKMRAKERNLQAMK